MAAGPRIEIEIIEKRFAGASEALFAAFRLDVEGGSTLAVLGRSGIGKSSLLRMIAGIDDDFTGAIAIGGTPAVKAPPPGFVFQDARLLPWLSAIDNILAVRSKTERDEAERWLVRVGLGGYENALPHELSGGMQRRVALARALSVNPRLLLLDEAFVSLDRQLLASLQALFLDLILAENTTTILVTHLPTDAALLADRAVVLDGRPVRVVADVTFASPRRSRSAVEVLEIADMLAAHSDRDIGPA